MARKPKPDPSWCTKAELILLLGVGSQCFDRAIRPVIPAEAVRTQDGKSALLYHAPTVFRVRVGQLVARELGNPKTAGAKIREAQQLKQAGQAAVMALLSEFCNAARSKPKAKRGKHVRKARG